MLYNLAKIEEEKSKDVGPITETTAKQKEENTSSSKHGETKDRKSPTKHDHHSKREHALKIKLPTEKHETRKRRHSSHRQSREETTQVMVYYLLCNIKFGEIMNI